jgi:hypothetical protein
MKVMWPVIQVQLMNGTVDVQEPARRSVGAPADHRAQISELRLIIRQGVAAEDDLPPDSAYRDEKRRQRGAKLDELRLHAIGLSEHERVHVLPLVRLPEGSCRGARLQRPTAHCARR